MRSRLALAVALVMVSCAPLVPPELLRADSTGDPLPGQSTGGHVPNGGGVATSSNTTAGSTETAASTTTTTSTSTGGTLGTASGATTGDNGTGSTTTSSTNSTSTTTGGIGCRNYGTIANHPPTNNQAAPLDFALDGQGTAWVTWSESLNGNTYVFAEHSEPLGFSTVANSATAPGLVNNGNINLLPRMVLTSGTPVIAWGSEQQPNDAILAVTYTGSAWAGLGGSNVPGGLNGATPAHGDPLFIAASVSPSNTPYVAWTSSSGNVMHVDAFSSGRWHGLNNTDVVPGGPAHQTVLAAASDTAVTVAWIGQGTSTTQVFVLQWNGNAWQALNNSNAADGVTQTPTNGTVFNLSLAIQPNTTFPALAWEDNRFSNTSNIFYISWNGSAWTGQGNSNVNSGISGQGSRDALRPALAFDFSGFPVIAYQQQTAGDDQIYMKRWNGSAWTDEGGSASGNGVSTGTSHNNLWPQVRINGSGIPVMAWQETGPGSTGTVHVCAWH